LVLVKNKKDIEQYNERKIDLSEGFPNKDTKLSPVVFLAEFFEGEDTFGELVKAHAVSTEQEAIYNINYIDNIQTLWPNSQMFFFKDKNERSILIFKKFEKIVGMITPLKSSSDTLGFVLERKRYWMERKNSQLLKEG